MTLAYYALHSFKYSLHRISREITNLFSANVSHNKSGQLPCDHNPISTTFCLSLNPYFEQANRKDGRDTENLDYDHDRQVTT